jgi:hypothetical protein
MTKPNPLPPVEELWEKFSYNPLTGLLYWRGRVPNYRKPPNSVAGHMRPDGYWSISRMDGRGMLVHRVIWKWMTGEDPGELSVDHHDRNPSNNRWNNLRLATEPQQGYNTVKKRYRNGMVPSSPYKGVKVQVKGNGKPFIYAMIRIQGKQTYLGSFPTEEAAHAAYCAASQQHHLSFGRTS